MYYDTKVQRYQYYLNFDRKRYKQMNDLINELIN